MSRYDDNSVIPIRVDDGKVYDFTIVASGIQYRGKTYSLIKPVDKNLIKMKDNEVIVCSVTTKKGGGILYTIEGNKSRSSAVIRMYNKSNGVHYSLGSSIGAAAKTISHIIGVIIKVIIALIGLSLVITGIAGVFVGDDISTKIAGVVFIVIGLAIAIFMIRSIIKHRR